MSRVSRQATIVVLSAVILCAMATVSSGVGVGLRLESGTVLAYDSPDTVGNGVGVHLTLDIEQVQASLGYGLVFPGSRVDSALVAGQLMGQWHPFRGGPWAQRTGLSPYASLGVGIVNVMGQEDASDGSQEVETVHWISEETEQIVGLVGLGVTYGAPGDLYLSAEARAVNHTHLALVLGAGVSF
jgi:hypothetical protein